MKGGRGSLTAGETDRVRFWVSSPRPASSVLATQSRLRETRTQQRLEETVLRASGIGAAGVGAGPGAASGQLANWIRERGGERHPRAGGAGPRGPGRGTKEPGSCPHGGRPASLHHPERAAAQLLSITRAEEPGPLAHHRVHDLWDPDTGRERPPSRPGAEPGPALGRRPGPLNPAGSRAGLGRLWAGQRNVVGIGGPSELERARNLGVEEGWGAVVTAGAPLTLCSVFPPPGRP